MLNGFVPRSSSRCRPEQEPIAWGTQSGLQLKTTPRSQSSPLMAQKVPSCRSCTRCQFCAVGCGSSGRHTPSHHVTGVQTIREPVTTYGNTKDRNKEIFSVCACWQRQTVSTRSMISKVQKERQLWEAVLWVPDLQCAWQVLLQCGSPMCRHILRTLQPGLSEWCAQGHDAGMMDVMEPPLGWSVRRGTPAACGTQQCFGAHARGRLGLRSATRGDCSIVLGFLGRCA